MEKEHDCLDEVNLTKSKAIPKVLLARSSEWRAGIRSHENSHLVAFKGEPYAGTFCPICGSDSSTAGSVEGIDFLECSNCAHLFSSISPSEEFLRLYYGQETSAQKLTYVELETPEIDNRLTELTNPKTEFIHSSRSPSATGKAGEIWIDIGSGVGDVLLRASELGYEAWGFEPDDSQAIVARGRGLTVFNKFLTSKSPDLALLKKASIVSLLNVVEHIPDSASFVVEVGKNMTKGTLLAIEVPRHPSVSSITQFSGLAPVNRHINPPEHLHIFSDKSMLLLLRTAGFSIRSRWTFGSDALELFYAIGSNLGWENSFDEAGLPAKINDLQRAIDQVNLSDNMLVVAQKI